MPPNRWLHLKSKSGFTPRQFETFRAHCRVFRAYVEACLADWSHFEQYPPPKYEFYEPEISADRTVATLPLGGASTLGTRAAFENASSRLLWEWFPLELQLQLLEGFTESHHSDGSNMQTNWRPALRRTSQ